MCTARMHVFRKYSLISLERKFIFWGFWNWLIALNFCFKKNSPKGMMALSKYATRVLISLLILEASCFVAGMNKMPPPEAKLYKGFSRRCGESKATCKFTSQDSPGNSLYFKCRENNICFCSRGTAPEDVLVWPVVWETESETCLVSKGGPCGEDNGLRVGCMPDLACIKGRCRNSTEIQTGRLNQFCNDDVDCRPGLYCHAPAQQNMEIKIKRCLS